MARSRGASKPLGRPGESEEDALARLTPFARAVQEWLWNGRGPGKPPWSRRRLAEELEGVSLGAVDSWFSRGTRPEPQAFWELVRVTGWEPDYLANLAGYDELPPHVQGQFGYLREHASERWGYDPGLLAQIVTWLDDMQREYERAPKRPRQKRKALSGTSQAQQAHVEQPTLPVTSEQSAKTTRRELASAGK